MAQHQPANDQAAVQRPWSKMHFALRSQKAWLHDDRDASGHSSYITYKLERVPGGTLSMKFNHTCAEGYLSLYVSELMEQLAFEFYSQVNRCVMPFNVRTAYFRATNGCC